MTARLLVLILCSVSLSAAAQILFKFGMRAVYGKAAATGASAPEVLLLAVTNPGVITGFAAYGASAILWLFILGRTDVSVAYPFVGVGFVFTMLAGWLLLAEPLTPGRVFGTLLVCVGVALIGMSKP